MLSQEIGRMVYKLDGKEEGDDDEMRYELQSVVVVWFWFAYMILLISFPEAYVIWWIYTSSL